MKTKRLLIAAAALCSISFAIPSAWAADGLQRGSSSSTQEHGAQSAAQTSASNASSSVQTDNAVPSNAGEHPSARDFQVRSSVQVTRETLREAYMASRDAYTNKLKKYAKCSPTEAKNAIGAAHPGMKIENIQLRNIRTSLVYVGVADDEEDRYLVVVDAGNGKVLMDKPLPTHQERVFAGGN